MLFRSERDRERDRERGVVADKKAAIDFLSKEGKKEARKRGIGPTKHRWGETEGTDEG